MNHPYGDLAADKLSESIEHDVSVERKTWIATPENREGGWEEHRPLVALANVEDSYYCQFFGSREEVERFIEKLRAAADEAWPKS